MDRRQRCGTKAINGAEFVGSRDEVKVHASGLKQELTRR